MHLKLPLGVNLNMHVLCKWRGRYRSKTPHGICTYVDESYIPGHHVSKDFCTAVINEVCSGSQEGKFWGRTHAQKNSQLLLIVTTDWNYYSYCKGQPSLFQRLTPGWIRRLSPILFIYGRSAC